MLLLYISCFAEDAQRVLQRGKRRHNRNSYSTLSTHPGAYSSPAQHPLFSSLDTQIAFLPQKSFCPSAIHCNLGGGGQIQQGDYFPLLKPLAWDCKVRPSLMSPAHSRSPLRFSYHPYGQSPEADFHILPGIIEPLGGMTW